ncbi:TPA: hypothetical protein DDZ86_04655 [Candidatus Dependentiae bacterium]|nr:MAG: Peptidoglycan-associated lipoprotein Pal (Modular protein) [candidate division TM6 bacterium GW2011_GWF2_43_87]HBL98904.1 hypothetical protein [Candidatus Dependentiae bacterium]
MKRVLVLLIALLVLAPACRKKQPAKSPCKEEPVLIQGEEHKKQGADATGEKDKKSLFLEEDDVDQFVFQEDGDENTFAPSAVKQESKIRLVEQEEGDKQWENKRADQARHGFKTIYFDYDHYDIKKAQEPALEQDVAAVKKIVSKDGKIVVVEGHACRYGGSAAYNMILSEKRAQRVAKYLVAHGVSASKLKVVGRGFEEPVSTDHSVNRRVELYTI